MYRKLFSLLDRRERKQFYIVCAMILVMGLFDMAGVAVILPFLRVVTDPSIIESSTRLSGIYDWLAPSSMQNFLIFLGAIVLGVLLISLLVKVATMYAVARFSQMRKYHLSSRLLEGYLRQPYVWFLERHSSQLTKTVMQEVDRVVGSAMVPAMRIIAQMTTVSFMLLLLLLIEPKVAISVGLVLAGLYMVIFGTVRKTLSRVGETLVEVNSQRFRVISEVIGGVKEVKLAGIERDYMKRFRKPTLTHAKTLMIEQLAVEMPRYLLEALLFGGMVILVLALLIANNGNISEIIPVLGLFAVAGLRMLPAVQLVYHSLSAMRVGRAVLDVIHRDLHLLGRTGSDLPEEGGRVPLKLTDKLVLDDVKYAYPNMERAAIDGMNMTITANTTVGIVGGTGAGKTTTVDVMLGLLRPDSGQMTADGVAITAENIRAWQDNVGYVPQQIFLTDDTVAANIAFGVPEAKRDQAKVERAAKIASLHDFVMSELPDGYSTWVGERGVRLSGGQRQRIGIARALYHDPDILILDEATSALDNITERAVMDAVSNLGHAKTIIMIAHRLTTVQQCDTIFLLENGRVSASGRYDELVEKNTVFRSMAKPA
ncbi:ABC transporter ATP-binding protein [Pseudooceanicola lipolyticus]|uniref:ABC transporter ATP-binding protein n=2 Tax=Paracoccaceae TaxID=31989 RepID=A0A2M8J3U8_9RHOB|nr:ABC transporter ATP-binding protein [Pseudooceanicola lipolyticus]